MIMSVKYFILIFLSIIINKVIAENEDLSWKIEIAYEKLQSNVAGNKYNFVEDGTILEEKLSENPSEKITIKLKENLGKKSEGEETIWKKLEKNMQIKNETNQEDDLIKKLEGKLEVAIIKKLELKLEDKLERNLEKKFEDRFEKKRNPGGEWISTTLKDSLTLIDRALVVGYEKLGKLLWIARATIQNELMISNVVFHAAYFSNAGKQYSLIRGDDIIEVFCASSDKVRWEESRNGYIPPNAVLGGLTSNGENLYIGRAEHENTLIPGKVYRGRLYVPFYGKEMSHNIFEVLCLV